MKTKNKLRYYYLYEIEVVNKDSSFFGKKYYGMHSTNNLDDDYYGSSTMLRGYYKKYKHFGLKKTILKYCCSQDELAKEEYLLVKQMKESLGDDCLNLNDGGYGSWSRSNSVLTKEQRHEMAVCGGDSNKKKFYDDDYRNHFALLMSDIHKNRGDDDESIIYSKVSSSLKEYYNNPDNKEAIDEKQLKNKESNIKSSRLWRNKFFNLFGHTPEYYRTYGLMKECLDLFSNCNDIDFNDKLDILNSKCTDDNIVKISVDTHNKLSIASSERHRDNRNKKSLYVYMLDGLTFNNRLDFINYVNSTYSEKYNAKLSNRTLNSLESNSGCGSTCSRNVKSLFTLIRNNTIIVKKEKNNDN